MSILNVTDHFLWSEFHCHNGQEVPDAAKPHVQRLCASLELIRARWGGPLIVISGWRSPQYNRRVGGAKASRHVVGDAADIRPGEISRVSSLAELVARMLKNGELPQIGGFGIYPTWIHVDCRPRKANGGVALWYGKGLGSER